jgi:DNA-binding YbaB/EbfC family protein
MDVQKLMKQAQKMQANLVKAQEEIAAMTFEGTSGGGAVKAITTGDNRLKSLTISPDVIKDGDAEMLSDLILTAVNSALDSAKKHTQERMASLTGGLGLPGF